MQDFAAIDFEIANIQRCSVYSVGLVKSRAGRHRSLCCHRAGDIITNCKI